MAFGIPELSQGAIQEAPKKQQSEGGRFKALRERVANAFRGNVAPTVIAGREVPEFPALNIPPMTLPDRPAGIPRSEPVIDATSGESAVVHTAPDGSKIIDATAQTLPEIHSARENLAAKSEKPTTQENPDWLVIDATNRPSAEASSSGEKLGEKPKEGESTVRQEMDQIAELTPEFRRKEIDGKVTEFIESETQDPKSLLEGIPDPTDQLYALAELARKMAFKSASHDGAGGDISPKVLEPQTEELYSGYKAAVYTPTQTSA